MQNMSLPNITANIPGFQQPEEEDDLGALFPELSFKERLTGFGVCLLFGFLITLSSFGSFAQLLAGRPLRFAVLYSLGNITSLCSTLFLVGPKRQYQNMNHSSRRVSAGIYLSCLLLTLVTVFTVPELTGLVITLVVLQWGSLFWYSLSYIPYGRRMARGLANRLLV